MKIKLGLFTLLLLFGLATVVPARSQSNSDQSATAQNSARARTGRNAGGDVGSGSGDIGMGTAKGASNLTAGTGKGAGDLVTGRPVNVAGAVGKGGASAGKNIGVGVGAGKGTGKIGKGVGKGLGKGIKHIF